MKFVAMTLLSFALLFTGCALTQDRQSAVDAIREARMEFEVKLAEATSEWQEAKIEEGQVVQGIADAQADGDDQMAAALIETLASIRESMAAMSGKQEALATSIDGLAKSEGSIKAEDAGEKFSASLGLLLAALTGGGAASGALQKLMPSRSKVAVDLAMAEIAKVQDAMKAYEALNGAASVESASVRAELDSVQRMVAAFMRGADQGGPNVTS